MSVLVNSGFVTSFRNRRRSLPSAQITHAPPRWTRRARTFPRSAQSRSRSIEIPSASARSGNHNSPFLSCSRLIAPRRGRDEIRAGASKLACSPSGFLACVPLTSELDRQLFDRQAVPTQLDDAIHHSIVFAQRLEPGGRPDDLAMCGLATSPHDRNFGAFGIGTNIDHNALGEKPYDLLAIPRGCLGSVPEWENVGGDRQDLPAFFLREPRCLFI